MSSGISDAKFHNIPAVYIIALNSTSSEGFSPIQDVSSYGINIIPQLKAELRDGCIIIQNIKEIKRNLKKANDILNESKPVIFAFYPDVLSQKIEANIIIPKKKSKLINTKDVQHFLTSFPRMIKEKRVIICVTEEASRCKNIKNSIAQLSKLLRAIVVWTVNGANAISAENPYGYGYIMWGGNDKAINLWKSINENDIVIMLGFEPGKATFGLEKIKAGFVWHFTRWENPYGSKYGTFRHRVINGYAQVRGDLELLLKEILPELQRVIEEERRPEVKILDNFNTNEISRIIKTKNRVDLTSFYNKIQKYWRPHSIGFDDVCFASNQRPYVTQRPHPYISFYSLYNGFAMGAAFGLGIGAKIANPNLHTFIFSGDGCWRFFGSALADVANLGLKLFIFNNGTYGLVEQGIRALLPNLDENHYHTKLPSIDFILAAKAHGWDGVKLKPNLSNLRGVMSKCYSSGRKSVLIEVPC